MLLDIWQHLLPVAEPTDGQKPTPEHVDFCDSDLVTDKAEPLGTQALEMTQRTQSHREGYAPKAGGLDDSLSLKDVFCSVNYFCDWTNLRLNAAASALTSENWSRALELLWSAGYAGLQLDLVGSNAVAAGLLGGTTALPAFRSDR